MDYEILGSGVEDGEVGQNGAAPSPPRRPAGILLAAGIGLGALFVVLINFGSPGDWSGAPAASAQPTPTPKADPSRGWVISDGGSDEQGRPPRTELSFGSICTPVLQGPKRLTVSFQVINTGTTRLRLLAARPQLALPGYLKLVRTRAGGDCRSPGDESASRRLLAPGEPLLITWTFRLLKDCPKPAPVGVRVRVDFISGPVALTNPLLADLGAVPFTDC